MRIGILHLTDIHFTEKTDLANKTHPFCQALIQEFRGLEKLYLVISGDVANTGKEAEYDNARKFLSIVKQLVTSECKELQTKYIMVPGNHDCNFQYDTQLRRNAIMNISYQTLGDDNSVIDVCTSVQKDFWHFYSKYNTVPVDKMFYQIKDTIKDKTVTFHCINTSWMSQINEEVGGVFFSSRTI